MFPFLGGLASGALGLIGGAMNTSAQQGINQQMLAMQQQQNAITNQEWQQSFGANQAQTAFSNAFNTAQFGEQDWLARNGIQARVADARAAGISPLAALGNPGIGSPSVSVSGGSPPSPSGGGVPNLTAPQPGAGVSGLGQDISRALQAAQDPEDRAVSAEKTRQDLEKGDLENQLLKTQIYGSAVARHGGDQVGPGLVGRYGFADKAVPYWQASVVGPNTVRVLPSKEASAAPWASDLEKPRYEGWLATNLGSHPPDTWFNKITGNKSGHWSYDPVAGAFNRNSANSALPGQNDRLKIYRSNPGPTDPFSPLLGP